MVEQGRSVSITGLEYGEAIDASARFSLPCQGHNQTVAYMIMVNPRLLSPASDLVHFSHQQVGLFFHAGPKDCAR